MAALVGEGGGASRERCGASKGKFGIERSALLVAARGEKLPGARVSCRWGLGLRGQRWGGPWEAQVGCGWPEVQLGLNGLLGTLSPTQKRKKTEIRKKRKRG